MPLHAHDNLSDRVFNEFKQHCPEANRDNMSWHWLLQGGFLAGQRFLCGDLQAIWLKKSESVEVLDGDGQQLAQFAWPHKAAKNMSALVAQTDDSPERRAA